MTQKEQFFVGKAIIIVVVGVIIITGLVLGFNHYLLVRNEKKLRDCLFSAEYDYRLNWAHSCPEEEPGCELLLSKADRLDQALKEEKDLCLRLYGK